MIHIRFIQILPNTSSLNDINVHAYIIDIDINNLMTAVKENLPHVPSRLINKCYQCHMGHLHIHDNRLFLNIRLIIPSNEPLRLY